MRHRSIVFFALACFAVPAAYSQAPATVIADIHPSAPTVAAGMHGPLLPGDRWELKNATLADLVGFAYGVDPARVFDCPSWLEFDHFDIIAKAPANASPDDAKAILQSLLTNRFKLAVHSDTHPVPGFALTTGPAPKLKAAAGADQSGCAARRGVSPPGAGPRVVTVVGSTRGPRRFA